MNGSALMENPSKEVVQELRTGNLEFIIWCFSPPEGYSLEYLAMFMLKHSTFEIPSGGYVYHEIRYFHLNRMASKNLPKILLEHIN